MSGAAPFEAGGRMRFGAYIDGQRVEAWKDHYLDYGKLKKMLTVLAESNKSHTSSAMEQRVTSLSVKPIAVGGNGSIGELSESDLYSALEAELAREKSRDKRA